MCLILIDIEAAITLALQFIRFTFKLIYDSAKLRMKIINRLSKLLSLSVISCLLETNTIIFHGGNRLLVTGRNQAIIYVEENNTLNINCNGQTRHIQYSKLSLVELHVSLQKASEELHQYMLQDRYNFLLSISVSLSY